MSSKSKKYIWSVITAAIVAVIVTTFMLFAVLNPARAARYNRAVKGQLRKAVTIGTVYHSIGRLWVDLTNYAWMGDANMATPSMEWPGGSGNNYLYQGSLWVAGRDAPGNIHASVGDEGQPNEFYPLLTQARIDSFEANGWDEFTSDDYVVIVASSNQGPNLDPEFCLWYDRDLYGKKGVDDDGDGLVDEDPLDFIDNDGDGLINEDFAAVSEEDTYAVYNDLWAAKHQPGDTPFGIEVIERTYAWSYSYAQDFIIYDYEVINIGTSSKGAAVTPADALEIVPDQPQTLKDVYFAIRFDFDISYNATGEYWYDDLTAYLASDKLSYGYDGDDPDVEGNDKGEWGISTGYLGVRTLGFSKDDKNMTEGDRREPSSHNWWTIDDDPSSDGLKFEYMSNGVYAKVPPSPYDYRYLHSVGPWDMEPGDTIRWVATVGVGEGLGDPADPDPHNTKGSLRDVVAFAQELYDADWLAATPPPSPDVTMTLQADGSLILDWSASKAVVEETLDPLSGELDFEGYRVYKSDRTDAAGARVWMPLASYDIPGNGVGAEAGLKYSYQDKDVLKGLTYYYAVTAFDNGLTPIGELESSKGAGIDMVVATPPAADMDDIAVVPNPYRGSAIWDHVPSFDEPWWAQIQFINLPEGESTIRIYTLSGDFIMELVNDDGDSYASWDLITRRGGDIVSGVYLFVVEDKDGDTKVGKFAIIR